VAIAPFESHDVQDRIDSAAFVGSAAEANQELAGLPSPNGRNNTALYSAFDLGLKKLQNERTKTPNSLLELFLVTDGYNDVNHPGDDPDLLNGDTGFQAVLQDVREYSQIEVKAIGVGDPQEVDQATLGEISNTFRLYTDAEGLKTAFAASPAPPAYQGLRATVTSPWPDRAWLAARTVHFRASLMLLTGKTLESEDVTWSAPEIGKPLFEGKCDTAEETALIEGSRQTAAAGGMSAMRPVLVFIGLAGALLMLWFWVPRLVWPERYGQTFQPQREARWTPASVAIPGPVVVAKRPAPPGFEQEREIGRAPQRAPADATRVLPINRMGTRTRLELKRALDDDRR